MVEVDDIIAQFNARENKNSSVLQMVRTIRITIEKDGVQSHNHLELSGGKITRIPPRDKYDITVETDDGTFQDVYSRKTTATKAFMDRKMRVRASVPDLMLMRVLLAKEERSS